MSMRLIYQKVYKEVIISEHHRCSTIIHKQIVKSSVDTSSSTRQAVQQSWVYKAIKYNRYLFGDITAVKFPFPFRATHVTRQVINNRFQRGGHRREMSSALLAGKNQQE